MSRLRPFVVRNRFDTGAIIAQTDLPVLLLHGRRDRVIPVSHGRRLAPIAAHARYVEYDSGHNDLPPIREEPDYWRLIQSFIRNPAAAVNRDR